MLTIRVEARDFMDGTPVEDAAVAVTVTMTAVWTQPLVKGSLLPPILKEVSDSGLARHLGQGIYERAPTLNPTYQKLSQWRHNGQPPNLIKTSGKVSVVVAGLDDIAVLAKAEREILSLADLDTVVTEEISVDFAKAIVGHTTKNSTRLWFAWNGRGHIANGRCVCEIAKLPPPRPEKPGTLEFPLPEPSPPEPSLPVRWVEPVSFDEVSETAVVPVEGLTPATRYRYALRYAAEGEAGPPELGRILATGEFTTVPIAPRRLSVAFGSCHLPSDEVSLDRWKALAARRDYDLLLLIGDQIYEDRIEGMGATPDEQYRNRYHQFLTPWPMREVLRRTPTYMIFDDHEVHDDWGTKFPDPKSKEFEEEKTREMAALLAYQRFQQVHNPGGLTGGSSAERLPGQRVYHYDFEWGPAAFFMLDVRSNRRSPLHETYPVLGEAQFQAFSRWANDPTGPARLADVVFVVTPVPIGYLPAEEIRRLVDAVKDSGAKIGRRVGFVLGGLLGAAIGHFAGKKLVEAKLPERVLADQDLPDMDAGRKPTGPVPGPRNALRPRQRRTRRQARAQAPRSIPP